MANTNTAITTSFPGVALITGAASGIGYATAFAFALAGCPDIVMVDANSTTLTSSCDTLRTQFPDVNTILPRVVDVSSEQQLQELFAEMQEVYGGRLDYCVNCAGVLGAEKISTETSAAEFDAVNNVNYRGLWLCCREEIKAMMGKEARHAKTKEDGGRVWEVGRGWQRGSIVNISSGLGLVGREHAPIYSASKAAVMALTRADAIDFAKHGIRVNAICPGLVETGMTNSSPELRAYLDEYTVPIAPMKRMGMPSEIADAALFLCSEKASFITGVSLCVDGGYTIV